MNDSLQRLLDSLNEKLALQTWDKHEKLDRVSIPGYADFEEFLKNNPPALTVEEQIWYNYIPQILKGVSVLLGGTVAGNAASLLLQLKGEQDMNASQINITTNIIGLLLFVLEPVRSYLASQPFNWVTFATCVLGSAVAYFTGKSSKAVLSANPNLKEGGS
jgi:hypothetical protein